MIIKPKFALNLPLICTKEGIEYDYFLGLKLLTNSYQIATLKNAVSASISFMKMCITFAPYLHQKKWNTILFRWVSIFYKYLSDLQKNPYVFFWDTLHWCIIKSFLTEWKVPLEIYIHFLWYPLWSLYICR